MMIEFCNDTDNAHEILKYLLANGACVNASADDDMTPLTQAASCIYARPDIVRTFLNVGARINPAESRAFIDKGHQYFRQNWKNLLTDLAIKTHAFRLFGASIAKYDTETVRGIIERISPEKIVPDCGESQSEFLRRSARFYFRINDFPEAVSKLSAQNTEIKRRLEILSLSDMWIGECLARRGERLMLNDFQQAKFMTEIFWKHNLSDITTVNNTRHYDGWEEYFGEPLSCHILSHLWELIESGTDYGGKWVRFRDIMMLLAACWGNVNDIEDAINHGGNVNYSTWLVYTPLMYASIFNTAQAVKFLIKNGADINARNIHNQNAAILAVMSDYNAWDSDVINVLAEFGADIHNGFMTLAVDAGNVDAVKHLLLLGAKLPGQITVNDSEPVTRNKKYCPKCGRIFERGNDYCPSCGYVLQVSERY